MAKTTKEKLEELIEEEGAENVVQAIKEHSVHPDSSSGCKTGYVLVNGVCVLEVGP